MIVHKLNESYSVIDAELETLRSIHDYMKVQRPDAFFDPLVKSGFKSEYDFFTSIQNQKLLIQNGHLQLLSHFGVEPDKLITDFQEQELIEYLNSVKSLLPFEPHDFQEKAFIESLMNVKQINKMCTSSGKSLTISMICDFLRQKGKKGLLLVPNINLLTQFKEDIKEYNLTELHENTNIIGGGQTTRDLSGALTISTWQSLMEYHQKLDAVDYIICDEVHRFASECTSEIIKSSINCKYKFGFTGTLPENPCMKMELFGLFGIPKTYITSKELIERGLGTPIKINSIIFDYDREFKKLVQGASGFPQKLKFIKEHEKRNEFIVSLTCKLRSTGNSLVLFQHTAHGKGLFIDTMKKLYPDVEVKNKDITGKNSFEFQKQYGVYFLNGEDNSETREKTRKILEMHDDATLISNYAILGTGVNIRKLHNMLLASPLKAYTTITQSIGRGMRLHPSKNVFTVFDLVDNINIRTYGGTFYKQYQHRLATSYYPEEYPVHEVFYDLS